MIMNSNNNKVSEKQQPSLDSTSNEIDILSPTFSHQQVDTMKTIVTSSSMHSIIDYDHYELDVYLREGKNLAARDSNGILVYF
jgi:hypothetical protein